MNKLPIYYSSPALIAGLGAGNLWPSPEFAFNLAAAGTGIPSYQMIWDQSSRELDSGNYPITSSTLVSNYIFGNAPTVATAPIGADNHILVVDPSTCNLYETYNLQNNSPPYHNSTGAIWNLKDYRLRSAYKAISDAEDSAGLDGGTASGIPILPLVLTHAEIFGVSGNAAAPQAATMLHAARIVLTAAETGAAYEWPATHGCCGSGGILLGATMRLSDSFDYATCHNSANAGQAYPAWFVPVLRALQIYGMYVADRGTAGGISTDTDQAWGDPASPVSDNWIFAGWLHCVPLNALVIVEQSARMLSTTSGQINLNFVAR